MKITLVNFYFYLSIILAVIVEVKGNETLDRTINQLVSGLKQIAPNFENISKDDEECITTSVNFFNQSFKDSYQFLQNCLNNTECTNPPWQIKLLDSLPIKPTGLNRKGPFFFLGDYETCKSIWKQDRQDVHWCTLRGTLGKNGITTAGFCIFSKCKTSIFERILEKIERVLPKGNLKIDEILCFTDEDNQWNFIKPLFFIMIILTIGLITIGTMFDHFRENGQIQLKERCALLDNRSDCGEDAESVASSNGKAPSLALTYKSSLKHISTNSMFIDIITSFSLRASISHLRRNSSRDIRFVNGLRVLTALWVVFSHTCLFSMQYSDTIKVVGKNEDGNKTLSSFMLNSSLAVDTFLFLSALVVMYSARKKLMFRGAENSFSIKSMVALLIHRTLRILPSLSIYLIFMTLVFNHLSDGPFWNRFDGMFGSKCSLETIWPHFTLVSNFFPSKCVPWLWYISLDFQLYLIVPFITFFFVRTKFGPTVVILLIVSCLAYRIVVYAVWNLPPNMFIDMLSGEFEKAELSFRFLYTLPFSRAPPFLIGIITGWKICDLCGYSIKHRSVFLFFQLIAAVLMLYSLLGPFSEHNSIIKYIHAVSHRTIWAIGLSILIFVSHMGYDGIFGFLGSSQFLVLSRLSYGIFLCHGPIIMFYLNTLRQPLSPLSISFFAFLTIPVYVLSIFGSLAVSLIIEIPIFNIERKLLMKKRKRSDKRVSFCEEPDFAPTLDPQDQEEMQFEEKTKIWLEGISTSEFGPKIEPRTDGEYSQLEMIRSKLEEISATSC